MRAILVLGLLSCLGCLAISITFALNQAQMPGMLNMSNMTATPTLAEASWLAPPKYVTLASGRSFVCIMMDPTPYWEPGDFWGDIDEGPYVEMAVDDDSASQVIPQAGGSLILHLKDTEAFLFRDGNVLGSHASRVEYCLQTDLEEKGEHSLVVYITTTSGREFVREMTFIIE